MLEEKHEGILKKYFAIWNWVRDHIGKDSEIKVVHVDKYLTTRIQSSGSEIRGDFHNDI